MFWRKKPEPFQADVVSLLDPLGLKEKLAPFVRESGAPQSALEGAARDRELGRIAAMHLSPEAKAKLGAMLRGESKRPLLFDNLALEPETVAGAGRQGLSEDRFYCGVIARAVYAACGVVPEKGRVLVRKKGDSYIPAHEIHQDAGEDFSAISCALNSERAPTLFIDLERVMTRMGARERERIPLWEMGHQGAGRLAITLEDYYRDAKGANMLVRYDACKHPKTMAKFNALMKEGTLKLTILPGQMVMFNNRLIYHQAAAGEAVEAPAAPALASDHFKRLVVYSSAKDTACRAVNMR